MLFEWAWAYFTWQRSSRVILEVPEAEPLGFANEALAPQQLRPDAEERAIAHAAEPHEAPTRAARLVRP